MKRFFSQSIQYFHPLGDVSAKQKGQRALIGVLVALPIFAWGLVLGVKGALGPVGWWLLMIFGMVGLLSVFVGLFGLLYIAFRNKRLSKTQAALVLWSLFVAWPASWLFGQNQIPFPAHSESVLPSAVIDLPLSGKVQTQWGGETLAQNNHVWLPVERWAYDFTLPTQKPQSKQLKDYPIFGKEVLSPVKGVVIAAYDHEADGVPYANHPKSQMGNYIYIQMDDTQTFLVLGHLKQGSVRVAKGDRVEVGSVLAKVGNSGNSLAPHLHIHHQKENPLNYPYWLSEGLPLYFYTLENKSMPLGGMKKVSGQEVLTGDWVTSRLRE